MERLRRQPNQQAAIRVSIQHTPGDPEAVCDHSLKGDFVEEKMGSFGFRGPCSWPSRAGRPRGTAAVSARPAHLLQQALGGAADVELAAAHRRDQGGEDGLVERTHTF